jgi:hypothetical protein
MEQADIALLAQRSAVELRVFVAGPYIEGEWGPEQLLDKTSAAKLRLSVHDFVKNVMMHHPVLGEHRGTVEMAEEHIRSQASVVIAEVHTLKNQCEAVIIIPSSPGSFCELGAWSRDRDICRKMLILADKTHENERGYVQMGVFKLALDRGAQIVWVNYEDLGGINATVEHFLEEIHDEVIALAILPD